MQVRKEDKPENEVFIPRLVNVYKCDWKAFQELCGERGISMSERIRELVREDIERG